MEDMDPATNESMAPAMSGAYTNRTIAIVLAFIFVLLTVYIWTSDWAHRELRDGFTLGGFPLFGLGLIMVSLAILTWDKHAKEVETGTAVFTIATAATVTVFVVALSLMFAAQSWIGFVPASASFILIASFLLGFRPCWKAAVAGIGAALIIRLILGALGVTIDDGPLIDLVGMLRHA